MASVGGSKICEGCQVLDDGYTNHSYCKTFERHIKVKEKEEHDEELRKKHLLQEEESLRRKRLMNEILEDHYNGETNIEVDLPHKKPKYSNSNPKSYSQLLNERKNGYGKGKLKFKCGKCEFITFDLKEFKVHESTGHNNEGPVEDDYFMFPKFVGFNCVLRGSSSRVEHYFVTEVNQPQNSMHDNLADTCYFFIPSEIIKKHLDFINEENVKIPFVRPSFNKFMAKFPNSKKEQPVYFATKDIQAEVCVNRRETIILTKSRFKIIQSRPRNQSLHRDIETGSSVISKQSSFCTFVDEDQVALEKMVKLQTESILQSCISTTLDLQPQVEIEYFRCVWENCKFMSDKKFSGIRNHLLKHFKERIEKDAKPRAMLSEREKSNCMSRTGCSVPVLSARGELVHHYGIFHCLIDDLFQEHGMNRANDTYFHQLFTKQCPYQDFHFKDELDLLVHLSVGHYFNLILSEVEDMIKFNLEFLEDKKCVANVYKCPFCKKKFSNIVDGGNASDLKELVIHCGSEHGFSLYYLLADENVESMRVILAQDKLKREQQVESAMDVKPQIKIECIEDQVDQIEFVDVNPKIKLECEDYNT